MGQRDRAILALFYGCGLRKSEGSNLNTHDINLTNRTVYIQNGKNSKQRYVPMTTKIYEDLYAYLSEGRNWFLQDNQSQGSQANTGALLLTSKGNRMKSFDERFKLSYTDLLVYVKHLKLKGLNNHTINLRINNIRKYYECLKENGEIKINPATRLKIKGSTRKIIQDPFKQGELEQLYYDYENYRTSHQRKDTKDLKYKMVLGLMIWQGIHSGELEKLEIKDINLQQCNIYLSATTRSNERTLPLTPTQILPLYQYLQTLPKDQVYLLNNTGHDLVRRLIDQLKKVNKRVQNARHIRGSVILNWLKIHGKRQVQYMAGHKWISSTEHYEIQELEELTGLLEKHHPLK